jgi:hypothetical protein
MSRHGALSEKAVGYIEELVQFLADNDAHRGLRITRQEIADFLDWDTWRVDWTIRKIREHPELGIGLTLLRGREPGVILSYEGYRMSGDMLTLEASVAQREHIENVNRLARIAGSKFNHYRHCDKRTAAAQRLYADCEDMRADLSNAVRLLRGTDEYEDARALVNNVLREFPY